MMPEYMEHGCQEKRRGSSCQVFTRLVNMTAPNHLPAPTRIITSHNDKGQAIISSALSEQPPAQAVEDGSAVFYLSYCTEQFPVNMDKEQDVTSYQKHLSSAPGLVVSGGTVLRHVDIAPGHTSPMHRTVSLDYGIVIEGEVELVLDSGERRTMRAGDIAIQRGTMHAWKNVSAERWARMLYVLQPSQVLTVGGQTLGEDYGGTMKGVRAST